MEYKRATGITKKRETFRIVFLNARINKKSFHLTTVYCKSLISVMRWFGMTRRFCPGKVTVLAGIHDIFIQIKLLRRDRDAVRFFGGLIQT